MRIIIASILIALLAACATPADRRSQRPDLNLFSEKSAKEVAICIADKWENSKPFFALSSIPVSTSMKPNGYAITATTTATAGNTNTIALVDIIEIDNQVQIKYYRQSASGLGDYDDAVTACQ